MNYLLIGEESYLLRKKLKQLIINTKADDLNVVHYDAQKSDMKDVILDCNTLPFFSDTRVVVLDNCAFLSTSNQSVDDTTLLDYLNHACPTTFFILVYEGKVDNRKKLVKTLKSICQVFEFKMLDEFERNQIVLQELKQRNINIHEDAYTLLLQRIGFDLYRIYQEITKLEIYGETINLETMESLIHRESDDDVFILSQALFDRNMQKCFRCIQDLKVNQVEVIALIGMLASQYRFLSQVKSLDLLGTPSASIAQELQVHPYRVKVSLPIIDRFTIEDIFKILNDLSILDSTIKQGKIEKNIAFETFVLKQCT